MTIGLQFLGAARHVTGSKHLLRVGDRKILIDCGMVQGPRETANRANRNLPEELLDADAVILSHAHIDHSGSLPRLVKRGYEGNIWCTRATADLASILLFDSAHIQAQDAKFLRRRKKSNFQPPYDAGDVEQTIQQMRGKDYRERFEILPGIEVEFFDAGHILGSAMVVVYIEHEGRKTSVAFSGDHGRAVLPVLRAPEKLPKVDVLLTESTYGNRLHEPAPDLQTELGRIINEELGDGGRLLIPAFSVGRTQNIVWFLGNLIRDGVIPKVPIYVDSPLSIKATKIMVRYPELWDDETRAVLKAGKRPFFFDGVRYVGSVEESKSLNDLRGGIIIAASGMCESGRIVHHLQQTFMRPQDCVLAVGYMATGTLGRKLFDGEKEVKLFGDLHDVKCKVRSMRGLSAHADYQELLDSFAHLVPDTRVFVVHGEEEPAMIMAGRLRDAGFKQVDVPVHRQKFSI